MENRKYKVCRDNIYVGRVIRTGCVYQQGTTSVSNESAGKLDVERWRSYRSILFTLNEDNLAEDLLYNSPNYPVLNISDDKKCMNFDERITLIKDAFNLSAMLKYYNYNEELTYEDIVEIRKRFFSSKFVYRNCEIFGYEESDPKNWTFYKYGIEITDPKKIKKCIAYYKRKQLFGCKSFSYIDEHILPREYWGVLNDRKDSTLIEVLSYDHERLDAFAPHKHEGKIKKLKR